MKYLNLFVMVSLLLSASAFAAKGSEGGNGGSGVMCLDSKGAIKSVTVLDLFEGKTLRGIIPQMGPENVPYEKKVADVIDRVDLRDHELAGYLRSDWSQFLKNTQFIQGADLVPIHDTLSLIAPRGCQTVQIAIHREKLIKTDKEYLINDELWNAMNNDNKAALVLHEMIYARAVAHGAQDSRATRYLVSLITSTSFNDMPIADYVETMKAIGITLDVNIQGYLLSLTRSLQGRSDEQAQVHPDGTISGLYTGGEKSAVIMGKSIDLVKATEQNKFLGTHMEFYPDGNLSRISSVTWGQELIVTLEGIEHRINLNSGIELHRNGSVKSAIFKDPFPFNNGGTILKVPSGFFLELNDKGRLVSFRKWLGATEDKTLKLKTNGKPEYLNYGFQVECKGHGVFGFNGIPLTSEGLLDLNQYLFDDNESLLHAIERGVCKFVQ